MTGYDVKMDRDFVIVPEPRPASTEATVALLNALFMAESRSFFRYMETWEPYTDVKTMKLRTEARQMMRRSFEHTERLARLIGSIGGATISGAFSKHDSHANYTGWANLLPRLIAAKQDMCYRYEAALAQIDTLPRGPELKPALAELLDENRADLASLEEWAGRLGWV